MNTILDIFIAVAPYINQLTNTDFAVSVCNLEKCLIYVPGKKQDHKLKSGSPHVKNSVAYECILRKKKVVRRVGSEVFGFPYIAIAIPIFDEKNKVIGSVSFTEAVDRQDLLLALADNLHETMQQMVYITKEITENSLKLKKFGEELSAISSYSKNRVADTNSLLGFIRTVSKKTNMLGLNVSTEAARLGKEGSRFMVVAEEIKKLSCTTDEYITNVDKIIGELKTSINMINGRIEELLNIASHQININNYINSLVKELDERTEKLKKNAQLINE